MKLNKNLTGIVLAGALTASLCGCENEQKEIIDYPFSLDGKIAEVPLPGYKGAMGLAAADFDGDGDIDLFSVRNYGKDRGIVSLYKNDGNGNYSLFGKIAEVPLPGYKGAMGLAAADFDGDGDIDLFSVRNYGKDKGSVTVYKNNGLGEFIKD